LHPHSAGPARAAGIRKFDRIVAVDGKPFTSEAEASASVAGEAGTTVTLTIARGGERFDLTLTRASVTADTVISELYEENGSKIGYIRILSFSAATAEQFAAVYEALASDGIEALILDVRDNGGGQLNTLVDILNYILPKDTPLLSYSFRNDTLAREDVYATDDGNEIDLPISVLINRNTASAGELLASVLRASGRATLIGERSFGKGSMQSGYLFRDGAYLSVSVATLSPIGLPTHHGEGLTPDVLRTVGVGYETASIYVLPFDEDHPLQAALSLCASSDE
jgi:carboxyl-terminal processing protease